MIYFTTFILALFLAQIARALPQGSCRDPVYPESSIPDDQFPFPDPPPLMATYDPTFDNPQGSLNKVACSDGQNGLVSKYPTFDKLPTFPYIGGAYDIVWNSTNCGGCWRITNRANNWSIHIIAIDTSGAGFNIAEEAYRTLSGGGLGDPLLVTAQKRSASVCGI
jgi:Cerato-platanin